jgi:hypothetical protein
VAAVALKKQGRRWQVGALGQGKSVLSLWGTGTICWELQAQYLVDKSAFTDGPGQNREAGGGHCGSPCGVAPGRWAERARAGIQDLF